MKFESILSVFLFILMGSLLPPLHNRFISGIVRENVVSVLIN